MPDRQMRETKLTGDSGDHDGLLSLAEKRGIQSLEGLQSLTRESTRLNQLSQRLGNLEIAKRQVPHALSESHWEGYRQGLIQLQSMDPRDSHYGVIERSLFSYDIQIQDEHARQRELSERLRNLEIAKRQVPYALPESHWEGYRQGLIQLQSMDPSNPRYRYIEKSLFSYDKNLNPLKIGSDNEVMNLSFNDINEAVKTQRGNIGTEYKDKLYRILFEKNENRLKEWKVLEETEDRELREVMKTAIELSSRLF
jgi:hypothetical protein